MKAKIIIHRLLQCLCAILALWFTTPAGTLWAAVPNAPSNLSATALSFSQIRIDWTDNSGDETRFYIERKIGAAGAYVSVANVGANVTTYTNSGLVQNTEYYYRVRAYNASGYSAYSDEVSAVTLPQPVPFAPSNLSANALSISQIKIDWIDNSGDETRFYIERKTGVNDTYNQVTYVGVNVTSYTNSGLTPNTEYYYRVRAYNAGGYSTYSDEVSATTLPLSAPSELSVSSASYTTVTLAWTDNSTGESGFRIERKTGVEGTYAQIAAVGANVTSYANTGLKQGTEYYYRVRAYYGSYYSDYSNEVNVTTSTSLPPPSGLVAVPLSSTQINLAWTDNSSDETYFYIERKTGENGTYSVIANVGANVTTYTNSGLVQNTEYYYRVRTYGPSGYSPYSNEVSATTLTLNAPSNLTATPLSSWLIVTWKDNSMDETSFYIEYKVEATDSYTALANVSANTTTYIHTNLTPDTTYHYRVRAYNSGGYSTYSNEASAMAPAAIPVASDSAGTEFFVAFQPNTAGGVSNLSLFITSQQDTQGVVEVPGLNFSQTFSVLANKVTTVNLPNSAQTLGSNSIKNLGVRVTSQNEVTVYGLNQMKYTTDAFLALPIDILGLEHIAMSYQAPAANVPSQVAVVGVYDNTQVTITPSAAAVGRSAGVPFTITLNRLDTFQLTGSGSADLTGSIITASAPVAVMSGVECVNVPTGYPWCDHIVEMMPPIATWGKSFLTVPLATRLKGDVFRILASQDNTTVTINGVLAATLNRGKFLEKVLTARSQIEAGAPVLVAQYSPGQSFDNVVSDPFMMLIPPTEQFLNQYTFSTPAAGFTANFVNIVAPSTAISSLYLDGAPINASLFSSIGSSGFSGAQVPIGLGSHTIVGNAAFGIYVYGFGNYDSYGYPGGMAFQFINPIGDSYSPNVRLIQVSDTIQGTATDSEDANANGVLDAGEDLNGNGLINRRSEDVNGNGVLDPGEDLNGDGFLDRDTGIFKVELGPGSANLQINMLSFIPGALSVNFSITLIDPDMQGTGVLLISDGVGNTIQSPISLSGIPTLKDVHIIDTISTHNIELDTASFSKPPYSVNTIGEQTVIEWRFDTFPINLTEDIGFDVIMKNPVDGEQRLVSHKLELTYIDANGNPVRTELGPQYVNVLNSVFNSVLSTDKPVYQANEDVVTTARITNLSEYARTIDAKVLIEDSQGVFVKEITTLSSLNFNASEVKNFGNLIFNTGSTYTGDYRTHLVLYEGQKQVGEALTSFKIQPTIALTSKVTTDRISYTPNQTATLTSTITSGSANYIFENLTATITINDRAEQAPPLHTETQTIPILTPEQLTEFKTYWNTSTHPAGDYPVTLEVKDSSDNILSTSSSNIIISSNIKPSKLLKGQISVDKPVILQGEPVAITYSVTNIGNIDLVQVDLSVLTVHAVNLGVYDTLTDQTAIQMGGTFTNTQQLNTDNYSAKDYLVILRASISGVEESLASTYFRVEGAPSAPSLNSPQNAADIETFTPLLIVNNASDPNDDRLTYQFELYTDSLLTNLIVSLGAIPEGNSATSWTVPLALQENSYYFWRARAYDGILYGDWMIPAFFRINTVNEPPTAPTLSSPADNSSISTLTPVLAVNNASDPDSENLTYNFVLATDPELTQVITSETGLFEGNGTTSWQVPVTLAENTWYYWSAQADDWFITGPWMTTAKFFVNTANDAPSVPVIISPLNNSEITSLFADIVLSNSADPDSANLTYIFELDTAMTFDSPNLIRSGNIPEGQDTTSWLADNLRDNTYYYVRAKASDGIAESGWSEVTGFFVNTANEAPTVPVLSNPSNGSGVNSFNPALSIHNSSDIDGDALTYEFEIYADAAMTNLVSSITGVQEIPQITTWTAPMNLQENNTYYWRARAFDGELNSGWMPPASFMVNTANDAPSAPVLYSPENGSSLNTLTPTLKIYNAVDPDSDSLTYDFEIYSGGALVKAITGIPQDNSGITSAVLNTPLSDNKTYSWIARAYDGDRYGAWMDMASFSIHLPSTNITATINFDPDTLNKKSKGNWVTVYIELPAGYNVSNINISSLLLNNSVHAETWPYAVGDNDKDVIPDLMVKFNRDAVINILPNGENIQVKVAGTVGTTTFEGVDRIRVIK
jgi:hypothetical protein